jgi:hypothetical protein
MMTFPLEIGYTRWVHIVNKSASDGLDLTFNMYHHLIIPLGHSTIPSSNPLYPGIMC